jgi:hypothetical protein
VVAYINATIASGTTAASIQIASSIGSDPVGNGLPVTSAGGGTITVPSLSALTCSLATLGGGASSTCTITLSQFAPAGGSTVTLASNNILLTVPASVTVTAGTNTATFSASAALVIVNLTATVTATLGSVSQSFAISLLPGTPAILSLSPNSGTGKSVTFTAVYTDPNGASDLNEVLLLVNTAAVGANGCFVYYQPQGNHLYLANNGGVTWITPALTPAVAGTDSNSQCTLNAGSSSVSTAGNNLTLNIALSFSSTFVGSKNVYLYASGLSGKNSGTVTAGTWTAGTSTGRPAVISLSPNSGPVTSETFTAVFSDPNGAGDLNEVLLLINSSDTGANACFVYYQPQGNHLYLANNADSWITPGLTPGVAGTDSNSQCTLNAGSSSVTMAGNDLTLSVALSFSSTFVGPNKIYLYASGLSGENSGTVTAGTLSAITSAGPPAVLSLSPNAGRGQSVTFTAVFSDPNGTADLNEVLLLLNSSDTGANACFVYYQPQANLLYLANNTDSWITPGLTPGAGGTVSNSQCTLNAASSSVSPAGNDLTLSVALTFSNTFVVPTNVYLYASGLSGQNSGTVRAGTWSPN